MLPKSRIFSVLLLGLGVALVAAGIVAPAFLNYNARMPLDLEKSTWTLHDEAGHARILSEEGEEPYEGPLTYQLHMDVQNPADEDNATIRVGESTMRGQGEGLEDLASAKVWTYSMDRLTGEAVTPANLSHTIASPSDEVPIEGYWMKFPADAEQTTYPVFDPTLRQARDAVFQEEMDIEGRTVYRYHQEIEPVNVATLYSALGTTTQLEGEEEGETEQGYLYHSGTRDYFVDQETGMIVGLEVAIDDYYGDRAGVGKERAFVFEGATSEEERAELLAQADEFHNPVAANIARWVAIIVGAILILIGLLGAFGAFGGKKSQGKRRKRSHRKGNSVPVSK